MRSISDGAKLAQGLIATVDGDTRRASSPFAVATLTCDSVTEEVIKRHETQRATAKAAFDSEDWEAFLDAHRPSHRVHALRVLNMANRLRPGDYERLLAHIWRGLDFPDHETWDIQFRESSSKIGPVLLREAMMTDAELELYRVLPTTVTVFRGSPAFTPQLVWTFDRRHAERQARCTKNPSITTLTCLKDSVVALFVKSGVTEVIILPRTSGSGGESTEPLR